MFLFWVSIFLIIVGIIWAIFAPRRMELKSEPGVFINAKRYSFIVFGMAVILLFLSCWTQVGTRNVGVPTSFSKTTGDTYGAGLTFKAPWIKVTDIDGTIQAEEYKGGCGDGDNQRSISVKIGDGGDACVSLAYRWRINSEQADIAFADYRRSEDGILEGIRKAVVSTNVKAALNEVLGEFEPLAGDEITPNMTPTQLANVKINVVPDYAQINRDVKENLEGKIKSLGGLVDIQSVTVSFIALPESTQKRINAFNSAVQETKIALQEIATKDAQATANNRLADSLKDPNVLVSKCLDGLISGDIQNVAGFSCSLGGGSAVVIPSAK